MTSIRCKATTKTGKACRNTPNEEGYCAAHFKSKERERYEKVTAAVLAACRAKGWTASPRVNDKNWTVGEIHITKWFADANREITATIDLLVADDGISYSIETTSFYSTGTQSLIGAIGAELTRIGYPPKGKKKKEPPDTEVILVRLLRNFDRVVRQLKKRQMERPGFQVTDEYDAQDVLHTLLRGYFDDVRPEENTPTKAGASARMDFLLKNEKVVVELKMASERLRARQIGEQLIIDINRYQSHPDCEALFCLVFDPDGHIINPSGLENDLSKKHDDLRVKVVITPQ